MTELKRLKSSGTRPGTTGRECRLLYNKCDVKRHHKLLNNSKTRLFVLYSQNYAARALPILFNTPKKSLLKSSYPKKYLPNFCTQKNPGIEHFKPQKILRSSPSLEIPSTPRASSLKALRNFCFSASYPQKIWLLVLQSSESFAFLLLPLRKYGLHSYNLLQKFHVFVYFFGKFCQRGGVY